MPKLSIITINLNNAAGLQKTMESVFAQTFTDYEYIIIDGGSTDGSKELIENNANKFVYWASEKDNGVYNAMNKGIEKAKGEYLLFLNSGDYFISNDVLDIAFKFNFTESIVYSDVRNNVSGKTIRFPEKLNFSFFYEATINHQSTFLKKELFEKYGLYNETYQIVSDWEFFVKCIYLYNESIRHLDLTLIEFDYSNGLSTSEKTRQILNKERNDVFQKYFPGFIYDYAEKERLRKIYTDRMETSIHLNKNLVLWIRKVRKSLR